MQVDLQTRSIPDSKWTSKLAWFRPPRVFLITLDYHIQVDLWTCSIMASQCIPAFTQSPLLGAPWIALTLRQQPVLIHFVQMGSYIDS